MRSLCRLLGPESEHCYHSYAGTLRIPAFCPVLGLAQTHPPYPEGSQTVGKESSQDSAKHIPKLLKTCTTFFFLLAPRKPLSFSKILVSKQMGSPWQVFQRDQPIHPTSMLSQRPCPVPGRLWAEMRRCHCCSPQTHKQNHSTRLGL